MDPSPRPTSPNRQSQSHSLAQGVSSPAFSPALRGDTTAADHLALAGHDVAFLSFIENWLEARGLKEPGQISPLLDDWVQHSKAEEGEGARKWGAEGVRGNANQQAVVRFMAADVVSKLKHLNDVSDTNYLLLLAPPFPTPSNDLFPHLSTSPRAVDYWHALRGGPATNLAKFLALSVPTTTTKRLAMPAGDRSLDVKARLNMVMRRMVREVSGREDAEMKWTKPESLIVNYGVKIVGWPGLGEPGERRAGGKSGQPSQEQGREQPGSPARDGAGAGAPQSSLDATAPTTSTITAAPLPDSITLADGTSQAANAEDAETAVAMMAAARAIQEQDKAVSRPSSVAAADEALVKQDDEYDEPIPLRNPSNNSVVQNKRLLALVESGTLRIVPATAADRQNAEAVRPRARPNTAREEATLAASGNDDDIDPALWNGQRSGDDDEGEYHPDGSGARKRKPGMSSRSGTAMSKRPRNKPEMTIEPDGTVRQGGLEGRRRPGRPRKSVPLGTGPGEDPAHDLMDMPQDTFEPMQELRADVDESARLNGLAHLISAHAGGPYVSGEMGLDGQDLEGELADDSRGDAHDWDEADVGPARTLAAMGAWGDGRR